MRSPLLSSVVVLLTVTACAQPRPPGVVPMRLDVTRDGASASEALTRLIRDTRAQADAFIFLIGGASKMSGEDQRRLLEMFGALADLAASGRRFAVGDGGTQAGIMQASGDARRASGGAFPLIGIAPAREIPPRGRTPIDPNHSAIIAVDDLSLPADRDAWGSETSTMYDVFARLAEERPSVAIVANGGGIALTEVEANVRAGRRMLLIAGSGRAADALVSLLTGTTPPDGEVADLRARADKAGLTRHPDLFTVVPLETGPAGLRDALSRALGWTE